MSGFYSAFPIFDQSALHLIPLTLEYVSCLTMSKAYSYLWTALNGMDCIPTPSNYLIMVRSTKQLRLSILPKDTNTLALAGLEVTV